MSHRHRLPGPARRSLTRLRPPRGLRRGMLAVAALVTLGTASGVVLVSDDGLAGPGAERALHGQRSPSAPPTTPSGPPAALGPLVGAAPAARPQSPASSSWSASAAGSPVPRTPGTDPSPLQLLTGATSSVVPPAASPLAPGGTAGAGQAPGGTAATQLAAPSGAPAAGVKPGGGQLSPLLTPKHTTPGTSGPKPAPSAPSTSSGAQQPGPTAPSSSPSAPQSGQSSGTGSSSPGGAGSSAPPPDVTAPETSASTVSVAGRVWTIAVAADEPATFECSLDGAGFAPCSASVSYANLHPGRHSFQARATDPAGNVDPTPATLGVKVTGAP